MTIHSSKGLEFPVVFLGDLAKNFNASDMTGIALCHKGLGLGIQYFDIERRLRWPSLYWYAVRAASERESRAEEARLLYVAMTRARDTLYLTASVKDAEKVLAACMTPLAGSGSDTPLPLAPHLPCPLLPGLDPPRRAPPQRPLPCLEPPREDPLLPRRCCGRPLPL